MTYWKTIYFTTIYHTACFDCKLDHTVYSVSDRFLFSFSSALRLTCKFYIPRLKFNIHKKKNTKMYWNVKLHCKCFIGIQEKCVSFSHYVVLTVCKVNFSYPVRGTLLLHWKTTFNVLFRSFMSNNKFFLYT